MKKVLLLLAISTLLSACMSGRANGRVNASAGAGSPLKLGTEISLPLGK